MRRLYFDKKLSGIIALIFGAYILCTYSTIKQIATNDIKKTLNILTTRIKNDLDYTDGRFDMARYNADPNTPYPHGSSGFSLPLYIITTDGFIIERNAPISGYLDSSDIKNLLSFSVPATITTVTNERWRVLSSPIRTGGKTIGAVVVSYYNPDPTTESTIDTKLVENINKIKSEIKIKNNAIDTNNIDVRNIHYEVSFEIVDAFNKVLLNNGRIPTFIDKSYMSDLIKKPEIQYVTDSKTNEQYILDTKILTDKKNNPVGIVVVGKSISSVQKIVQTYLIFSLVFGLAAYGLILTCIAYWLTYKHASEDLKASSYISKIRFNKKNCQITINDTTIDIPYASNQYYVCEALFSKPSKRFEQDELLERFGEESSADNWRKVYDAVLAINKKTGYKLVVYKDKTIRINPEYLPFLLQ